MMAAFAGTRLPKVRIACRAQVCLWLIVFSLMGANVACAQTTATYGESAIGVTGCNPKANAADFDAVAQCNASSGTGILQKAPLFAGIITSPPYAATTCTSGNAGMVQYTGSVLQKCYGSGWVNIAAASCDVPAAISFTNISSASQNKVYTSNAVTLSGANFTCMAAATCTASSGTCSIVRNGVTVGPSANFVSGDTVALQLTTSASNSTSVTATVTIGATTSTAWQVTTGTGTTQSGCVNIGDVCGDGSIYVGITPDTNTAMYAQACDYPPNYSGTSCSSGEGAYKWLANAPSTYTAAVYWSNTQTGKANTTAQTSQLTYSTTYYSGPNGASNLCTYTQLGHNDWYLPAKDELHLLAVNHNLIPGIMNGMNYWSSTNYTVGAPTTAAAEVLSTGEQSTSSSNSTYYLRCVRHD